MPTVLLRVTGDPWGRRMPERPRHFDAWGRDVRVGQVQFVTASDVQRLKQDILGQVSALDVAYLKCIQKPGALDAATEASWHAMKNRALQYAGESAPILDTAAAMNAGQAIQRDLSPWYDRFTAAGGSPGPKPEAPEKPKGLLDALGVEQLGTVALVFGGLLLASELIRRV
jgi:hypothetical protein